MITKKYFGNSFRILFLTLVFYASVLVTGVSVSAASFDVYAQWEPNTVRITFDSNGGGTAPSEQVYTYGQNGVLPGVSSMKKEGYEFVGWGESPETISPIANSSDTAFGYANSVSSSSKTLYAIWKLAYRYVTLQCDSSTYSDEDCTVLKRTETVAVMKNDKYTFPIVYKQNQSLSYWKNTATGVRTSNNELVITADGTYEPVFETGKYTVTLNTNGGLLDGNTKTIRVTYGSPYGTLPIATKEGYGFDGWFTENSGGTRIVDTNIVKIGKNHTLYAHWSQYDIINWSIYPGSQVRVNYTGSIQMTTLPPGKYLMEAYGASGGKSGHNKNATYGGYAGGYFTTNKPKTIYVVIGGVGIDQHAVSNTTVLAGGYNGAGNGAEALEDSSGGGSASHIALLPGLLAELSSHRDAVLVVGGGAGGNGCSSMTGGHGGYGNNTSGADGAAYGGNPSGAGKGGTLTSGGAGGTNSGAGSFGTGGSTGVAYAWPGAGGGDNLSGGGGSGGGGSSYANTTYISNPSNTYTGGPNAGLGYAVLKCIELY